TRRQSRGGGRRLSDGHHACMAARRVGGPRQRTGAARWQRSTLGDFGEGRQWTPHLLMARTRMTPTVIQRLREAIERAEHIAAPGSGRPQSEGFVGARIAIDAVEQELAAKDAEIAELRKDSARLDWIEANPSGVLNIRDNGWHTRSASFGAEWSVMLPTLRDAVDATLYAEKARAEAPK